MQEEFAAREQALTEERRRREEAEALVTDQHQGSASDGASVVGRHHADDRPGERHGADCLRTTACSAATARR